MLQFNAFRIPFLYLLCILLSFSNIAKADINDEKESIIKQYDIDYYGGEKSLYNKRFGEERVIPREESVIMNSVKNVSQQLSYKANSTKPAIRLLDFGCGDGRIFPVISKIAQNNKDRQVELIAYDLSFVGLKEFIKQIELQGLNLIHRGESSNINKTYVMGKWSKENLSVIIIHASIDDNLSSVKLLIEKPIHVIFSMFTPLGHIPGINNRQAIITKLKDLLDDRGEIILNVSTRASLPNESLAYEVIREQYEIALSHNQYELAKALKKALRIAIEPGDLYYSKHDEKIATHNYGHVYSKDELIEGVKLAGLEIKAVKVMSIKQPYQLTTSKISKYIDSLLSEVLSWPIPIYPF